MKTPAYSVLLGTRSFRSAKYATPFVIGCDSASDATTDDEWSQKITKRERSDLSPMCSIAARIAFRMCRLCGSPRGAFCAFSQLKNPWRLLPFFLLAALMGMPASAQIQQAWVARYNNGIANGIHQAIKMALDANGNVYIAGFSQNNGGSLGYVTIKYAPNGNQLWAARHDSVSYPSAKPAAMMLDASNNVAVTGSALTIRYDSNGNQLWTAPYAGTALAVDSNANIYVAGFSTNFGTVKLSPQGSNVWLTTYVDPYGPTLSQSVLVDASNNVYVSGLDTYFAYTNHNMRYGPFVQLTTIKYDSNGNQVWKASQSPLPELSNVQIGGAALDAANNLYLVTDWFIGSTGFAPYVTYKYAPDGNLAWAAYDPTGDAASRSRGLVVDNSGEAVITGINAYDYPGSTYGTYKLDTNGAYLWTNVYPNSMVLTANVATSIAIDSANNSYVTGYSPGTGSGNDVVTIKYDPNGNQKWLQRYNGPGNGDDESNAIAVDASGNVYVTGYETTAAGGTEIVTIKYSPVLLQKRADGSVLLEAQGSPGESFQIEASQDLQTWLDLGSIFADSNGLAQFTDTNAPTYPARFYLANPQ
jgi:hypothetical protein